MFGWCIDFIATFIEGVLLYCLMDNDWSKRIFHPVKFFMTIVISMGMISWMTYLRQSPEQKLVWVIFLLSGIGIILHKISLYKAVLLSCLLHLSVDLGEIVVQVTLMTATGDSVLNVTKNPCIFAAAVIFSKLLAAFFVIWLKISFGSLRLRFDLKISVMVLIPLILMLFLLTKLEGMILGYTENIMIWNERMFSIILLVSAFCLVVIFRYTIFMNDIQITENMNEQQMEKIYKYYQTRLQYENETRKIYHDLKKHMAALEAMEAGSEKMQYAARLNKTIKDLTPAVYTGNEMIDLVIQDKRESCNGIYFSVISTGNLDLIQRIECYDLVAIFGNALDNAIEALNEMGSPEKIIDVRIKVFECFILFEFSNACPEKDIDYMKTSKDNDRMHGFGISNIIDAVNKYNGYVEIQAADHHYILQILIPV